MPELPEVETIARGLSTELPGLMIRGVAVYWPGTVATPGGQEFADGVRGRRVTAVGRRGKYLVIDLDKGHLLVHLKMTGRLRIVPAEEPVDRHTHLVFDLDDGRQLRFRDIRKFGRAYLVRDPDEVTGRLGPEPLDGSFTVESLQRLFERRSGRLKSLLLDQSFIAGLGNIYADEVLFRSGLHPLRRAATLDRSEQERLHEAIGHVLRWAVDEHGTTLDDGGYVNAQGEPGGFQERIAVYGRAGEPCPRCGTAISRLVVGGRSTHFCPRCQPEGGGCPAEATQSSNGTGSTR